MLLEYCGGTIGLLPTGVVCHDYPGVMASCSKELACPSPQSGWVVVSLGSVRKEFVEEENAYATWLVCFDGFMNVVGHRGAGESVQVWQ